MEASITISKHIKEQATIQAIGHKFQLKMHDKIKPFKDLLEAIRFCNVMEIEVTNKASLSEFFQSQLIH
jgi:hypothetical protein